MKIITGLCMAILLLLASSCGGSDVIEEDYPWPASGVTEADSLMMALLHMPGGSANLPRLEELVNSLAAVSSRHPDNMLLGARSCYWRARLLFRQTHSTEGTDTLLHAMAMLDSASHPYDYFKLRSELERTHPDAAVRFRLGQENVNYFREAGDSLSVAHSLLSLGFMYLRGNDSLNALGAFTQAGEIWRRRGMVENYTKNLINTALVSPRDRQFEIYRELAASPVIQADTGAYEMVLRNLSTGGYPGVGDSCSRVALRLVGDNPRYRDLAAIHRGIVARGIIDSDPAQALELAREAYAAWTNEPESYEKAFITQVMIDAWDRNGHPDSALAYSRTLNAAVNHENDLALAISIEAGRHALAEANLTASISRQHQQRTFLIVLLATIIIAGTALFLLYRRRVELEMREKMARSKLQESQSRLARETLLFEEKEQMLEGLRRQIEDAASTGSIPPTEAGKILSTLKVHAAGREERQTFLDIYDHMLPSFSRRLKSDFPALTEGQLKLAAYIGSGMSNASIAKLLNITVPSVRTNRYRLRQRFGLAPQDSLEDFIRNYTAHPDAHA